MSGKDEMPDCEFVACDCYDAANYLGTSSYYFGLYNGMEMIGYFNSTKALEDGQYFHYVGMNPVYEFYNQETFIGDIEKFKCNICNKESVKGEEEFTVLLYKLKYWMKRGAFLYYIDQLSKLKVRKVPENAFFAKEINL